LTNLPPVRRRTAQVSVLRAGVLQSWSKGSV